MNHISVLPLAWEGNAAKTAFGAYTVVDVTSRGLGYGLRFPNGDEKIFYKSAAAARNAADRHFRLSIRSVIRDAK